MTQKTCLLRNERLYANTFRFTKDEGFWVKIPAGKNVSKGRWHLGPGTASEQSHGQQADCQADCQASG